MYFKNVNAIACSKNFVITYQGSFQLTLVLGYEMQHCKHYLHANKINLITTHEQTFHLDLPYNHAI